MFIPGRPFRCLHPVLFDLYRRQSSPAIIVIWNFMYLSHQPIFRKRTAIDIARLTVRALQNPNLALYLEKPICKRDLVRRPQILPSPFLSKREESRMGISSLNILFYVSFLQPYALYVASGAHVSLYRNRYIQKYM